MQIGRGCFLHWWQYLSCFLSFSSFRFFVSLILNLLVYQLLSTLSLSHLSIYVSIYLYLFFPPFFLSSPTIILSSLSPSSHLSLSFPLFSLTFFFQQNIWKGINYPQSQIQNWRPLSNNLQRIFFEDFQRSIIQNEFEQHSSATLLQSFKASQFYIRNFVVKKDYCTGFPRHLQGLRSQKILNREYQNRDFKTT